MANMRHQAKCSADRSNRCRDIVIFIFSTSAAAILDFFKCKICNGPNGHEGWTVSPCQISLKSLKLRPRYGDFSIFQNAAATLNFWNYKFLTMWRIVSVELHHRAKFRGDRWNHCRDISISMIFKISNFNRRNDQEGRTSSALSHYA